MADQQARALRRRLSRDAGGRGTRYPAQLRADVGVWARKRPASGASWSATAGEIGMKMETVRRWAMADAPKSTRRRRAVPVEIALSSIAMRVVSPSGYRVEGLALDEVATLLRELS